jgi:hypothetical protein
MAKRSIWFEIRKEVGAHTSCPVIILPGDFAPILEGKAGHMGRPPMRFGYNGRCAVRRGALYHPSTLIISIGRAWLERERPEIMGRILAERMVNPIAYRAELRS